MEDRKGADDGEQNKKGVEQMREWNREEGLDRVERGIDGKGADGNGSMIDSIQDKKGIRPDDGMNN